MNDAGEETYEEARLRLLRMFADLATPEDHARGSMPSKGSHEDIAKAVKMITKEVEVMEQMVADELVTAQINKRHERAGLILNPNGHITGITVNGRNLLKPFMADASDTFEKMSFEQLKELMTRMRPDTIRHGIATEIMELKVRMRTTRENEEKERQYQIAVDGLAIQRAALEQDKAHHKENLKTQKAQFAHSLRLSWIGAVISFVSALSAIGSAWYARSGQQPSNCTHNTINASNATAEHTAEIQFSNASRRAIFSSVAVSIQRASLR